MRPLQVGEPASRELAEAVRWYEERRPGWGARLLDVTTQAFDLIERHPEIGSPRKGQSAVRQCAVRGFPYTVVYQVGADGVYVVAVAHTSRRPGYWKTRR